MFALIIGGVACGMLAHVLTCGLSLALLSVKLAGLTSDAFAATGCSAVLNSCGVLAARCHREFLHRRSGPYPTGALP